jgi:hypothetical protein
LTGRKVSDDEVHDDTSSKKKNNVASTLKNDVLTDPGKYIYSSFTPVSLGLEVNNGTPMLSNTPVMNAQDLLLLYKNQVAVPKGASNSLCELFEFVSGNVIVSRFSEGGYWRNTRAHGTQLQ